MTIIGGDFKIAWNTMSTHLTIGGESTQQLVIPSGEINFSAMERNNEHIKEIMKYVRAITSFVVIAAFMKNVYHTLLITLGISTQIYEKETEEDRKAMKQEKDWKNRLEKQKYNQWLREHRK